MKLNGQTSSNKNVYLFPGLGSDERLFEKFTFDPTYNVHHVTYPMPEKGERLKKYAERIGQQVDTSQRYILIGVSLGGMICTELADLLEPEKVIIISSAKCRQELPARYRFQKSVPLLRLIPTRVVKAGAKIFQPIIEPDCNKNNKPTFKSMLGSKDAVYLKRTANMIITWDRTTYSRDIIHIHGSKDNTLPLRLIDACTAIKDGSHMMTLTRGDEINYTVQRCLAE